MASGYPVGRHEQTAPPLCLGPGTVQTMRSVAKRIVELGSRLPGLGALRRRRLRNGVLILAYHNIVPEGAAPSGEQALHLPQEQFRKHLAEIARQAEVVPLSESMREPDRARTRPRVVITFDDAYLGALTAGLQELAPFGFPATFFVCPGRLGGQTFWWDHLAKQHGGVLPGQVRNRALVEFQGRDEPVLKTLSAGSPSATDLPPWMRTADEELLRSVSRAPGLSLGAHSWSHPNLAAIPDSDVERELTDSLTWVTGLGASGVRWLAYPYGLEAPRVRRMAEQVGFEGALLVSGGWLESEGGGDRFGVPRYNVPAGLSAEGLALRLMGFLCR